MDRTEAMAWVRNVASELRLSQVKTLAACVAAALNVGRATLSAIGLSVKPGGSAQAVEVDGGIITNGAGIAPIELHGAISTCRVSGGFKATGGGFDKI